MISWVLSFSLVGEIDCSTYVSTAAAIAGVVAVDVAGEVGKGEVLQFHAGVVRSFGGAGVALVDVGLGDEDWEGDVVDAHVAPGVWVSDGFLGGGLFGSLVIGSPLHSDTVPLRGRKLTAETLVKILRFLHDRQLTHVTFSTSPWPPTQDFRRAAYKPPATVIRSK
jgi:hypothetical protein